jgi:hypothetical protein
MAKIRNRIWAIEKVCSKNRQAASAPRPAADDAGGFGQANVAATLAPFGFSVCMRSVWTKAVFWLVEGRRPRRFEATQKRCKKALASGSESCNIGGASHQYSIFLEARFGGFSFFRSSVFLQVVTHVVRPLNRFGHGRVCQKIGRSASALQPSIDL